MSFLQFLRIALFAPSTFIKEYIVPDNKEKPYLQLGAWIYWGLSVCIILGISLFSNAITQVPHPGILFLGFILSVVVGYYIEVLSYKIITFLAGKTLTVKKIRELLYYRTIINSIILPAYVSILMIIFLLVDPQHLTTLEPILVIILGLGIILGVISLVTVMTLHCVWSIYFFYKMLRILVGASRIRALLILILTLILTIIYVFLVSVDLKNR